MLKTIQDSVHGSVKLDEWQIEIIDTPQFQRLRRIKQLGFANLVYPGANHTRFEHSIGTMFIASKLSEDEEIVAAALIHDIGHTPFSHSAEDTLQKFLRKRHEDIADIVRESRIKDILEDRGLSWRKVVKRVLMPPVSGPIDADRIDYLLRDSHYTGVAYGVIDIHRLLDKTVFDGDKIYIESGGLRAAESLLISRYLMYSAVYLHHVCRIAKKMFEKALEYLIDYEGFEARRLRKMDDYDIISLLRSSEGLPREIIRRIDNRDLYKRALYIPMDCVEINVDRVNVKKAEEEIAERADVELHEVIVDIPEVRMDEYDIQIEVDGEMMNIDEISPLVRSLKEQAKSIEIGVYTTQKNVENVKKAALDFFKIRASKQKKLEEF